jgi:hypothetical protein
MMPKLTATIALASLLGIASAGCEGARSRIDAPAEAARRMAGTAAKAGSIAADEASAVSPGKPLPPIEVDYAIVGATTVGQPVEIELRTAVPFRLAALNLALSGSERLQVPAEVAQLRQAFSAAGERHVETVRVTPLAPGRHYLTILAEARTDGRVEARSVTIPIDVGDGSAAPPPATGPVSVDADGERIISLPARQD